MKKTQIIFVEFSIVEISCLPDIGLELALHCLADDGNSFATLDFSSI